MDTIAWLTITTITVSIVAVLNGITALVVGVSKFRWSKVISEAKEAQIKGLETEVQNLRELTPMRLQEYAKATASLLGEQIDGLEEQLRQEHEKLQEAELKIIGLKASEVEDSIWIREAVGRTIGTLNSHITTLNVDLQEAQQDMDAADRLSRARERLSNLLAAK